MDINFPTIDRRTVTVILPNGGTVICDPDQVGEVLRSARESVPQWQPIGVATNTGLIVGKWPSEPISMGRLHVYGQE